MSIPPLMVAPETTGPPPSPPAEPTAGPGSRSGPLFAHLVGRVTNTALALAVVLERHAGADGTCCVPVRDLAGDLRCTDRTVRRVLRELEAVGFVTSQATHEPDPDTGKLAQGPNRYRLNLDGGAR